MEAEWHRIKDAAPSPLSFVDKLRSLKVVLKVWNRESFGSVDLQIETTIELLNDLEEGGMVHGRWVTSPTLLKRYVSRFFCVHFSQRPIGTLLSR
ncbi:hypothetical protein V6N13_016043 [Hibiscus sabdariffa]